MRALCSRPWSRSPLSVSVCLCLSLFASVCLRFPLPVCAFVCVNPSVAGRKVCGPSFVQVSFPDCLVVQAFTPHHYAREGLDRGERERERGPRVDDTRARVHRWTLCTRMCPTNFQSPWIDESQLFTRRVNCGSLHKAQQVKVFNAKTYYSMRASTYAQHKLQYSIKSEKSRP
jgi:hypothetical protein